MKKLPSVNRKGINIVQLSIMMDPPKVPKSPNILDDAAFGPKYVSGTYTIKLVKGTDIFTTYLKLNDNPEMNHTFEDRKLQRETLMKAYNLLEELASVAVSYTHLTLP